uniref:C2 domain-containing protein n=1 Tax=Ananas comosus var. bracteatus TaxID=296719 RepID=A0A6V7Q0E4_ANACO|nr:unnamed protein product [Ananas comosus var. bracteatus]
MFCHTLVARADRRASFFHNQLGVTHDSSAKIDLQAVYGDETFDLSSLQTPFTLTEVKRAVFSNAPEKAPGPDGLPMLFYQRFWNLLKDDIMSVFNSFYNDTAKIDMINTKLVVSYLEEEGGSIRQRFPPYKSRTQHGETDLEGEILLTVSLYRRSNKNSATHTTISSFRSRDNTRPVDEITPLSVTEGAKHSRMTSINNSICAGEDLDIVPGSHLAEGITNNDSVNKSATLAVDKDASAEFTDATFEEAMEIMQTTGTTDYQETPWTWKCMDPPCLTRAVSYTKAATKLVKAVKATEEQTYVKADGKRFAVMVRVSTPEVPSSTVMKSMIEGSARQDLKKILRASQTLYLNILNQQLLRSSNSTRIISTIVMVLYVLLHILLSQPAAMKGLEFDGLDLPDTFGEDAKSTRSWLASHCSLVEGKVCHRLFLPDFQIHMWYSAATCVTRTSSVQLQTSDPQWNEIMEFDAMQEPPSVLDVEVFNFDGPFDLSTSLGHAEINFLKTHIC